MNRILKMPNALVAVGALVIALSLRSQVLAENGDASESGALSSETGTSSESSTKSEGMVSSESEALPKPVAKKNEKKARIERADSFVAGTDWEFDGFVAGGQDEAMKSMFYQGDLIYLNIGSQQGLNSGDRVAIYKRGNKIKDPQTGKFMGFEVRRAAYAVVTDRIDENTCSVRVERSFEAIELKDLAKRE